MDKARKSVTEKIYEQIRDAIIFSRLKPGERLSENKLREKFKVSRTPVREALIQLQAQGYTTVGKNKSAVVRKASIEEVEELYSILSLLEPYSAGMAARWRTKKDITRLEKIFNYMTSNMKKDDLDT